MKKLRVSLVFYLLCIISNNIHSQTIDYHGLGKLPTKDSAILFAPGMISQPNRYERVVAFDPNGSELFFSVVEKGWTNQKILSSKYTNGKWQKPELANFSKNFNCAEPFISPNGKKLFFVSNRSSGAGWNFDIWMLNKVDTSWSAPIRLDENINTEAGEWHPTVSKNGDLYFASQRSEGFGQADLYFSKYENEEYCISENLGATINTEYNEWDPYISPDNRYLIFKSDRPGGYGHMDMYISLRRTNKWSTPKNLGSVINTEYMDDTGYVTPDGKYLIFARKNDWEFMDIYWIETGAIKKIISK